MSADKRNESDARERLIMPVAAVVLVVWTAALVVGFLTESYVALTITTPVMLMLAGYVFGVSIVKKGDPSDE